MGISPITNLMPLAIARTIESDLEPVTMERVEDSARTGDETYSPSNQKSSRGAEDDGAEGDVAEDGLESPAGEDDTHPNSQPESSDIARRISFLA
jgi:hypothetical protein